MAVEFGQSSIREWLLDTQERSTIEDVVQHGCQGGTISELIYYHDTSASVSYTHLTLPTR